MRNAVRFLVALIATLLALGVGGAAIVYGGADDSPGLQGIGVIVVIGATVAALRWQDGSWQGGS
ncbi:hypothetical protein [Rhodococcus sp. IEGM 1408]|uniref:hypothetical protein n=1 Tax=Rhodococcus sp. IEGM 1408 TaxID=3082220 RepID=UPI0029550BC7|nr:hypothetical protein [Rhodococcus sp. IEGM 1408]MDV8001673.1 hypothetical protein [Rhodococcus sp. IEGM 1408]